MPLASPLHQASLRGDPEVLELMLEYCTDLLYRDENGQTTLRPAAHRVYGLGDLSHDLISLGAQE